MQNADDPALKPLLVCSRCGKSQADVSDLSDGPEILVREFICDDCVSLELAQPMNPMPAFSPNLNETLGRAVALAEQQSHERARPEHVLLAFIDDPDAARVMRACNVDLEKLRGAVSALTSAADGTPDDAIGGTSHDFQTDLQRAAAHVRSIGREETNGADILVAMLAGPAAGPLHAQGMSVYDATTFISHGITRDAQAERRRADEILEHEESKGSSMSKVGLLNDDYTPMEFVVFVLEEVFELEHDDAVRIMLQTHHEGLGICGTFPREEAEARTARVMDLARQHQHPLRCRLERAR
jgi:ATP-dependent Clp protease adapter protein ClpS